MECGEFRARYRTFTAAGLARAVWESDEFSDWSAHRSGCRACCEWDLLVQLKARGVDASTFPCVHLAYHSTMTCSVHADPWECPDMTLIRVDRGFGIPVRDGGGSYIAIDFCPWCGRAIDG